MCIYIYIYIFNKLKIKQIDTIPEINLLIIKQNFFHRMLKNTKIKIINDFIQAEDLVLTVLANQIFSNHTHEINEHDNQEIIQHLITIMFFNHKTQLIHNFTNQIKCITKFHCQIIYNNMK